MKRFEYMKRFLYLILLGGILGGFLAGCKGTPQKQAESGNSAGTGKPTVTVTIPPYKYFVDKIAENKVDVNVMATDYVSWANGIKAGGYATDPDYASKLISEINMQPSPLHQPCILFYFSFSLSSSLNFP